MVSFPESGGIPPAEAKGRRMQMEIGRIGGVLRLGDNTRIVTRRREGGQVRAAVTAPMGTALILVSASLRPISTTISAWADLCGLRRCGFGRRLLIGGA
jgi:hypothetical protein